MPEWLGSWITEARATAGRYGVDPAIFAAIYLGAIPFFWLGTGWILNSVRRRRSPLWAVLFTGFCFVSPYLYVALFGRGLPWWAYALMAGLVAVFGWQSYKRVQGRIGKSRHQEESRR